MHLRDNHLLPEQGWLTLGCLQGLHPIRGWAPRGLGELSNHRKQVEGKKKLASKLPISPQLTYAGGSYRNCRTWLEAAGGSRQTERSSGAARS